MKLIINADFFAYQLHDKNGINFITDLDKLDKIDILYNSVGNKLNKTPEVEKNKVWHTKFKEWLRFDDNKNFKRHSFSCGIISKLENNICNRIFNIYRW